jgi:hypothetical protein
LNQSGARHFYLSEEDLIKANISSWDAGAPTSKCLAPFGRWFADLDKGANIVVCLWVVSQRYTIPGRF